MRLTYHIFRFLERRGYYICRSYKRPRNAGNPLQLGFAALLSSGASPVYCVQIGAADGVSNDPLRPILASQEGRVKAVLVEPQPGYAASLRELYQNSNSVEIFEVAVARESGTLELHLPKDPKDAQKASLNADQRKKFPTVEFETIPVRAVTVRELLEGAKFERVDLLQIDAEGLDYEILSQFFESGIFPKIIHLEIRHLDEKTRSALHGDLRRYKYAFLETEHDSFCWSRAIGSDGRDA